MSENKKNATVGQKIDKTKIGKTIKLTRQQKGYTQAELARLCQLPRPTLCNIERGHSLPSLQTIMTIASVLGASIDQLLSTDTMNEGSRDNVYLEMSGLLMKCKEMDSTELEEMLHKAVAVINSVK